MDPIRASALQILNADISECIKKRNKVINYKPAEYVKIAGETYRSENEIMDAYGCGMITASQEEYGLARLQSKKKEELVEVNTIARDLLVDLESIAKDQLLNAQGKKSQMVRLEHAHWVMINGEHCECSNCRTVVSADLALNHKTRYCMGCGAKMDEEEER